MFHLSMAGVQVLLLVRGLYCQAVRMCQGCCTARPCACARAAVLPGSVHVLGLLYVAQAVLQELKRQAPLHMARHSHTQRLFCPDQQPFHD
jgi:hypothetical protein